MSLFDVFKNHILSPIEVIQDAIGRKLIPPHDTPQYIKENFSALVEELQIDAYRLYLETEKSAGQSAIRTVLSGRTSSDTAKEEVIAEVCSMFTELDRFFLSLTQSRRTRAGSAFENVLRTLFKRLNYPFDEQQVINGKPDFLMPSRTHYDSNPMDCIIFTAKRTLRERWRQIVTEGTRGLGFYLSTIDESISANQLDEMRNHRIYLVIPINIKDRVEQYRSAHNVITFEEFFRYHLDPAITRWTERGII
jgi:hypothetical protein